MAAQAGEGSSSKWLGVSPTRSPKEKMMARPVMRWVLLAGVCGIAGALYFAHRTDTWFSKEATDQKSAAPAAAPVPVRARRVARADFPVTMNGLGTVQAWNQVMVRSRVDGEVMKIAFQEGQDVKEGDVLVELDPRPFQASLDQATAKITQDQANLKSAKADLDRTTSLSAKGFASKQLLDQQTAAVNQLEALIKADQAAQENAKVSLGYTTIRAPIAGKLGLRNVDIGNIVHATDQSGIVTITQVQPIAVTFTAPETHLPAILEGMKKGPLSVIATSPDGSAVLGQGTLSAVNNSVDTASGTIVLKGKFDNSEGKLWPGMSVATRLVVRTLEGVVAVPEMAVQRGPTGLYAYVVGPDSVASKRDVKIGPEEGGSVVVESGLDTGDQVIVSGHYRVAPGARVELKENSSDKIADNKPATGAP